MSDTDLVPCPAWAEKLADFHSHNLSPSDQSALEEHLMSCQVCTAVLCEYQMMDEQIHKALDVQPHLVFTAELLQARVLANSEHASVTRIQPSSTISRSLESALPNFVAHPLDQMDVSHEKGIGELLAEDVDSYFPAFAKMYKAPLRKYVRVRGAAPSDVDDITHDSLVEMYLWLKGCRPQKIRESNLKGSLYRIVENRVRVKQRENRRDNTVQSLESLFEHSQRTDADIFDELIGEGNQLESPEDVYLYKEGRQEILQHLTEGYRKVFIAHLDGWTVQEIATHFGGTPRSVQHILRQSRKILQSIPALRY